MSSSKYLNTAWRGTVCRYRLNCLHPFTIVTTWKGSWLWAYPRYMTMITYGCPWLARVVTSLILLTVHLKRLRKFKYHRRRTYPIQWRSVLPLRFGTVWVEIMNLKWPDIKMSLKEQVSAEQALQPYWNYPLTHWRVSERCRLQPRFLLTHDNREEKNDVAQ